MKESARRHHQLHYRDDVSISLAKFYPHQPEKSSSKDYHVRIRAEIFINRLINERRWLACPAKPQQIFIERWLPYDQPKQRVIYQPAKPTCCIPDPKNVVIQWDSPDVEICRRVIL